MKTLRLCLVLFLIAASTQKISSMDTLQEALENLKVTACVAGAVVTERVCSYVGVRTKLYVFDQEFCERLLAVQNYAELSVELHQLIDHNDMALRLQVHNWIVETLKRCHDPLLLYMDARTILKYGTSEPAVHERALTHFILCTLITDLSCNVLRGMARCESAGHQLEEIAQYLKAKFEAQYSATTFTPAARKQVPFKHVRDKIIGLLRQPKVIEGLPLPFWALRTVCGSQFGWGIAWGALTIEELEVRNKTEMMDTIKRLTQRALEEIIEYLKRVDSWERFLVPDFDEDSVEAVNPEVEAMVYKVLEQVFDTAFEMSMQREVLRKHAQQQGSNKAVVHPLSGDFQGGSQPLATSFVVSDGSGHAEDVLLEAHPDVDEEGETGNGEAISGTQDTSLVEHQVVPRVGDDDEEESQSVPQSSRTPAPKASGKKEKKKKKPQGKQ